MLTAAAADWLAARAARLGGAAAGRDPEIGPEEIDVVNLFLSLSTQWRRGGLAGVRTGLDYAVVPPTASMLGIMMTPALLHDLRVMESEAIVAMPR